METLRREDLERAIRENNYTIENFKKDEENLLRYLFKELETLERKLDYIVADIRITGGINDMEILDVYEKVQHIKEHFYTSLIYREEIKKILEL